MRRSNAEAIEGAVQATILVPGCEGLLRPGSYTNSHGKVFQNYDCDAGRV
jgi:hypothetical protein